ATLLLTNSEGSHLRFSRMARTGVGSFLNSGNAGAQGNRGLHPSDESRRTAAEGCLLQLSICLMVFSGYCKIKGRIANSALINCVMSSRARIDNSKCCKPYDEMYSGIKIRG